MHKFNEADDKEENITTILKELNKIGEVYFGEHYVSAGEDPDDDPIEALTKKQFKVKYEEEVGEENDGDEASFSDAFRHAALIDVDTLKVPPLELWSSVAAELAKTDYVFTWEMINKLPAKLAGTQFVAIHFDTDGSILFVPIPG
jgi:hypothetical protein